jgi:hypothetical protein
MATPNSQTPSKDKDPQKAGSREAPKVSPEKTQAQIDDDAKQTFPASDAPGGWAGKDIAPQDRVAAANAQKKS